MPVEGVRGDVSNPEVERGWEGLMLPDTFREQHSGSLGTQGGGGPLTQDR